VTFMGLFDLLSDKNKEKKKKTPIREPWIDERQPEWRNPFRDKTKKERVDVEAKRRGN